MNPDDDLFLIKKILMNFWVRVYVSQKKFFPIRADEKFFEKFLKDVSKMKGSFFSQLSTLIPNLCSVWSESR